MVQKVPPPVGFAIQDPVFNRWLLELVNILNGDGTIDPSLIPGFNTLQNEIDALNTLTTQQQQQIGFLTALVNQQQASITALLARNQVYNGATGPSVGLGVDGDWYYNRAGGAGSRLYIRVGGAWVAQAI